MNNYEINGYKRITKAAARRVYNGGGVVFLCPVKLRPGFPWYPEIDISRARDAAACDASERDFDKHVNAFEFYNCALNETGKYAAFYVIE